MISFDGVGWCSHDNNVHKNNDDDDNCTHYTNNVTNNNHEACFSEVMGRTPRLCKYIKQLVH